MRECQFFPFPGEIGRYGSTDPHGLEPGLQRNHSQIHNMDIGCCASCCLIWSRARTTADLDIALHDRDDVPEESLERAGFIHDGRHEWSDNWRAPAPAGTIRKARIAIQFSADRLMSDSVNRAVVVRAGDLSFPLVRMEDLILLKLAAAEEPRQRESKRQHDVADVTRLLSMCPIRTPWKLHPFGAQGMEDPRQPSIFPVDRGRTWSPPPIRSCDRRCRSDGPACPSAG